MLRQDPDDILIGEMRDPETVSAALTAAQTGHFVMSTLHTIDATETINRIIDFFPLHQQKQVRIMLAGTLQGHHLAAPAAARRRPGPRAGHRGHGDAPAASATSSSTPTRPMLIGDAIKEGEFYGMQTFDQALLHLYEEGLITLHDAAQVAQQPARLQAARAVSRDTTSA